MYRLVWAMDHCAFMYITPSSPVSTRQIRPGHGSETVI